MRNAGARDQGPGARENTTPAPDPWPPSHGFTTEMAGAPMVSVGAAGAAGEGVPEPDLPLARIAATAPPPAGSSHVSSAETWRRCTSAARPFFFIHWRHSAPFRHEMESSARSAPIDLTAATPATKAASARWWLSSASAAAIRSRLYSAVRAAPLHSSRPVLPRARRFMPMKLPHGMVCMSGSK